MNVQGDLFPRFQNPANQTGPELVMMLCLPSFTNSNRSRSDAYKPSFSIFAKRCPHLFPIYKQVLVSHNQPHLLPTTSRSRRPWKNLARWPLPEPSTPNLGVPCSAGASTHGKLCRTGLVVSRLALQP